MTSFNVVVIVAILYAITLFGVAFWADRAARSRKSYFFTSPLVYTLSLSVYCTAWTFYGAVGSAARNGFEFLTIYLGPTLLFVGWWWFLRLVVKIGRKEKLTSIADFVSARYGKSNSLGAIVTLIAIIGTTPYIALQLQSLTLSFSVFTTQQGADVNGAWGHLTALILAAGLAVFITMFGTRNLNASERHEGVVTAIALEAIVKLAALVIVGIAVVYWITTSPTPVITDDILTQFEANSVFSSRWATIIFLSAFAIICLPRMFQVLVVENHNERQLALASWAFPAYLFVMCLFVVPIALFGLSTLGPDANPDLFVLNVPLSQGQDAMAIMAFLGGFSSATSMVIMAALALATMVSNHLILPFWVAVQGSKNSASNNVRLVTLVSRRLAIFVILALGYLYFRFSGGTSALSSIGLIAFLGVSQIIPCLVGGIFWKGATKVGALSGVIVGFLIWGYTLFLPSFGGDLILSKEILDNGLFGLSLLKPYALFGSQIDDPLVHAFLWSLGTNAVIYVVVSIASKPSELELFQAIAFQADSQQPEPGQRFQHFDSPHELLTLSRRILGTKGGNRFFKQAALEQKRADLPDITPEFIESLEREFAGVVGAATAQAMISQIVGRGQVSVSDLFAMADESAKVHAYSSELEAKSAELESTANQLRKANMQLVRLGEQRDNFLSQISHELRTPMTSIRSFSDILQNKSGDDPKKREYFASIIHDESLRLTRLLDEILELSYLESGRANVNLKTVEFSALLSKALVAADQLIESHSARVHRPNREFTFKTDADRLVQALINLISNGIKHNLAPDPQIWIDLVPTTKAGEAFLNIQVKDNGPGIEETDQQQIFEKFAKLSSMDAKKGVGLGLPISARIARLLGGELSVLPCETGACFVLCLPLNKKA